VKRRRKAEEPPALPGGGKPFLAKCLFLALVTWLAPARAPSDEWRMPVSEFLRFRNVADPRDGSGSCVQASLSMVGAHHGVPPLEYLLTDSPYGPAELGGSYPARVKRYCQKREVAIYSVEGSETIRWIDWALHRGCFVAITYGQAHMITAVAVSEDGSWFEVCDNNYPEEVRRVDRQTFIHEHRVHGGGWCVIAATPGPPCWARAGPPEPRRGDPPCTATY